MHTAENRGNDHKTLIHPRPTKVSGVVLIVSGFGFLLFSILPLSAAEGDAQPFATIFAIVWILVCLSFVAYGVHILVSKKPSYGIVYEIEDAAAGNPEYKKDDFETRLRKLESLKNDGLITEEEYTSKRNEVMKERW